jgi:hypothetical protein
MGKKADKEYGQQPFVNLVLGYLNNHSAKLTFLSCVKLASYVCTSYVTI